MTDSTFPPPASSPVTVIQLAIYLRDYSCALLQGYVHVSYSNILADTVSNKECSYNIPYLINIELYSSVRC